MADPTRTLALRLISRRDYTAVELRQALIDRDVSRDDADRLVADFVASRLVDDRRVAEAFIRTAASVKRRGRLRIARELEARGVNRALVRELVANLSVDDEAAAIEKVLRQKRLPETLDPAGRRRIFQHLLRRGFPADAVSKALARRGGDADDTMSS